MKCEECGVFSPMIYVVGCSFDTKMRLCKKCRDRKMQDLIVDVMDGKKGMIIKRDIEEDD